MKRKEAEKEPTFKTGKREEDEAPNRGALNLNGQVFTQRVPSV